MLNVSQCLHYIVETIPASEQIVKPCNGNVVSNIELTALDDSTLYSVKIIAVSKQGRTNSSQSTVLAWTREYCYNSLFYHIYLSTEWLCYAIT